MKLKITDEQLQAICDDVIFALRNPDVDIFSRAFGDRPSTEEQLKWFWAGARAISLHAEPGILKAIKSFACKEEKPVNEACLFKPVKGLAENGDWHTGIYLGYSLDGIHADGNIHALGFYYPTVVHHHRDIKFDKFQGNREYKEVKRIQGYDYGDNDE